jgi:hypothetical protein
MIYFVCDTFGEVSKVETVTYTGVVMGLELDECSPKMMQVFIALDKEKGGVELEGCVLDLAGYVLGQRVVVTVGK